MLLAMLDITIAEMLHEAGEALLTMASLTAQMQHTAGEALLNMGSIVTESLPIAGETLLNAGSLVAELLLIGFAHHGSMITEMQHKAGKSLLPLSPVVGFEMHAGVLAQSISCSLSTAAK
jgi:hypothetical protein